MVDEAVGQRDLVVAFMRSGRCMVGLPGCWRVRIGLWNMEGLWPATPISLVNRVAWRERRVDSGVGLEGVREKCNEQVTKEVEGFASGTSGVQVV